MSESARAAASALGLLRGASPDARVELYEGSSMGCRLYVATHAGVSAGPAFAFQANPVVVIVACFAEPVPGLAITTTHMAPHAVRTGDHEFDQVFKVQALPAALLDSAEVRRALLGVYAGSPAGSGMLVDVDGEALVVRCHEPRPRRAADVARATLAAAVKLGQRAAFLR